MAKKIVGMERGSVKFHTIGKTQFWLTPVNRIFIVTEHDLIVFPRLQGGIVQYDEPTFTPSEEMTTWLTGVLQKQKEIRSGWTSREEDEDAFTFS